MVYITAGRNRLDFVELSTIVARFSNFVPGTFYPFCAKHVRGDLSWTSLQSQLLATDWAVFVPGTFCPICARHVWTGKVRQDLERQVARPTRRISGPVLIST